MKQEIKTAFILAAGKGTRMKFNAVSKPMVRVGKKTLIMYGIEALCELGVNTIYIVYHQSGKDILEIKKEVKDKSVQIFFIEDKKQLGTLESFACIEKYVDSPFYLMDADVIVGANQLKRSVKEAHMRKEKNDKIELQVAVVKNPSLKGDKTVAVEGEYVIGFNKKGFLEKDKKVDFYQGGMFYIFYQYPSALVTKLQKEKNHRFSAFLKEFIEESLVGVIWVEDMWDVDSIDEIKKSEEILDRKRGTQFEIQSDNN